MEQDEKRASGKKYLDMVEHFEWQKETAKRGKRLFQQDSHYK
jgi:hypothetical protein